MPIRTLDELGRALASKDLAAYRFRIEGHTDTVGSRDYNRALSERRAEAVVDYVAKNMASIPAGFRRSAWARMGCWSPPRRRRRSRAIAVCR